MSSSSYRSIFTTIAAMIYEAQINLTKAIVLTRCVPKIRRKAQVPSRRKMNNMVRLGTTILPSNKPSGEVQPASVKMNRNNSNARAVNLHFSDEMAA